MHTDDLIQAVAGYGLPGHTPAFPYQPLDSARWRALVDAASWERIVALLAQAIDDGAFPASREQHDQAIDLHLRVLAGVLHLETALLQVADVLDRADVAFRVLKGPSFAHLDYPNPAQRQFGDLDLLIPPHRFDAAIAALTRHGFVRRYPEPRPGFDRRFTKSVSVAHPDGTELDLHRTLAAGGFGQRIVVETLWANPPQRFMVGDRDFDALGPNERLIHACYHMALGNAPPRLVPQRDIAQMLLTGKPSPDRVLALAAAWRGEAVVAHAIGTTWQNLRLSTQTELSAWSASFVPRSGDRSELARATSPAYTYAAQSLDAVRALRTPRERLAYVSALAFPRRSYVRDRYRGFTDRLRQAASGIAGARTTTKENR